MEQKKLSISEIASLGGKARAKALTKKRRSEIARDAVTTRHYKDVPLAVCEGVLDFADISVPCAVLPDQTRVLSERGVTKGFGLKRAGSNWQRKKDTGARLPVFVSAANLKSFMDSDLRLALTEPVLYRPKNSPGSVAFGTKAELIPRVCDVWLRARDAGALLAQQMHIAIQADLIMRAFAHVGIIALIDEATGFQDYRTKNALAQILEEFVAKELQKWMKTFPAEFYKELFRLRGLEWNGRVKRPQYIGHLTNDLVYARLAPGVLKELRKKNPTTDAGHRRSRHHQWLTNHAGHPKLLHHLGAVTTLMKISESWDEFKELLDKHIGKYKDMPLFPEINEDED